MLVESTSQFPTIPPDAPLVIDVETTSFDDKEKALCPYRGHRVCGIAIATIDAKASWYLPIRHHHADDSRKNLPLDTVRQWMRDLLSTGRDWINHKIKFDAHFLKQDGIETTGRMLDTIVLSRLVEYDLMEYNLDYLANRYLQARKLQGPTAYLNALRPRSVDYGRVPIEVLGRYAENDAILTARLYAYLLERLPAESRPLWETEIALTRILYESEREGVQLDTPLMARTKARCLREMIDLSQAIEKEAGEEVDPLSDEELTRLFIGKFGIEPISFTKKEKKPQWNQVALDTLSNKYPICKPIARFRKVQHFLSSYIDGWLKRADENGRMHADFHQAGTITGRLSCTDPNLQNVPVEAEMFIHVDDDEVLYACDWSQIEYRFFGHYARDQGILDAYMNDPRTDFHGEFARLLGVPRQFAKQLNFSFLYGMGKSALLRNVAGILKLAGEKDPEMRATMLRNFVRGTGKEAASRATQVSVDEEDLLIAESIYDQYHQRFPSIKELTWRIKGALYQRGWIKNFYGRIYKIDARHSYVGVNYLIQGSVADFMKQRIVAVDRELKSRYAQRLLINVHDALYYGIARAALFDFYRDAKKVLEESPLRIPIVVEGKVASKSIGQVISIDPHETDEKKIRALIEDALKRSEETTIREWGTGVKVSEETMHGSPVFRNQQDKIDRQKGRLTF